MSGEKNNGLVVLRRWKFLLLLFAGMSFASLFSIVVMAEFMLNVMLFFRILQFLSHNSLLQNLQY